MITRKMPSTTARVVNRPTLSALPVTQNAAGHYSTALGTTYSDDPVLGIVSALGLHGTISTVARYYVGALAATILLIATNAGMIGISLVVYLFMRDTKADSAMHRHE